SPVLVVANTGEPLSAEGVQSLATLRASAKSSDEGSVGRFGVGFASVLAVSDEPVVLSRTGSVRFSRADTAAVLAELGQVSPGLAAEIRRRDGHVPVLRLPFEAEGSPPAGFDTAVVLPLRDEACADLVRHQLEGLDDALLLALPALESVDIDVDSDGDRPRRLAGAAGRWHVLRRSGTFTDAEQAELLADRPTEERRRRGWQVLWALPRDAGVDVPAQLHAPTPTDERLSLPAMLLATFPLDPARRHVAPGPLTDRLVREAAQAYAELLGERAAAVDADAEVLALVPTGLAAGALDGALREAVLERLPRVPLLRSVERADQLLQPREAVALDVGGDDPAALAVLGAVVAGLVASPRSAAAALAGLGVERIALSDVVDALPTSGEPEHWRATYNGLARLADDANAREVLASLPVPLADGRVVRGARGALLPTDDRLPVSALATLSPYGLRVVHPLAAHPLLGRLGATLATARAVLEEPATRVAVDEGAELDEPHEVAEAVLALVAAALQESPATPGSWADGDLAWLSQLVLTDDEGEPAPAGVLVLPGSIAADLLDPEDVGRLAPDLADAWPAAVLTAVGVLDGLATVRARDVDLDDLPDALADLADVDTWVREVGPGSVAELVAVRDLDLVRDDAWPRALRHLAGDPQLRRALTEPVRVGDADGRGARSVPSYTAWWLQRELGTVGLLDPAAPQGLQGLLDAAPDWLAALDDGTRRALGLVSGLAADRSLAAVLLQRLNDPDREVDVATCLRAWAVVGACAADLDAGVAGVRVLLGTGTTVVPAGRAVVADDARWLQRSDLGGLVVVAPQHAEALADLLDVPLAGDVSDGRVTSEGRVCDVPAPVRALLPGSSATWVEHDELLVDGREVDWWVEQGQVHASTSEGLARALAFAAGEWAARHAVAAVLQDPADVVRLLVEDAAG
ncbi:MAG TPA: hypothetical protein VF661_06365, partial [Actinomycetales bacterium]